LLIIKANVGRCESIKAAGKAGDAIARLNFWSKKEALPSKIIRLGNYRYSALLDSCSIKLLKIVSIDAISGRLRCSLDIVRLHNCPPFTALSYTWALTGVSVNPDEEEAPNYGEDYKVECQTTTIEGDESRVTNGYLTISENLFDMLFQLAGSGHKAPIWIDAMCINQKDITERASQVSLMGEIYSKAVEVLVWLGKDKTGLNDFLWLHRELLPKLRALSISGTITASDVDNPLTLSALGFMSVEMWDDLWDAYRLFCASRRWFFRVWIVQEISLAHTVTVWCGNKVLP
jgi:hypothetical protein